MTSTIVCKFVILTPVVTCISALYDCIHQGDDSNISIVIYNRRSFVRSAPELWSLWQIPPPFLWSEVAAAKILMILSCLWYQPASKSLLRTLIQNNLFQLSPPQLPYFRRTHVLWGNSSLEGCTEAGWCNSVFEKWCHCAVQCFWSVLEGWWQSVVHTF